MYVLFYLTSQNIFIAAGESFWSLDSGEFLKATPSPFCNLVARDLFHDELTKNTPITSPSSLPSSLPPSLLPSS